MELTLYFTASFCVVLYLVFFHYKNYYYDIREYKNSANKYSVINNYSKGIVLKKMLLKIIKPDTKIIMSSKTFLNFNKVLEQSTRMTVSNICNYYKIEDINSEYVELYFRTYIQYIIFLIHLTINVFITVFATLVFVILVHIWFFIFFVISFMYQVLNYKIIQRNFDENKKADFNTYIDELLPLNTTLWKEVGSSIFKLFEGYRYREYIRKNKISAENTSIEYGIHDGVISSLHLSDVKRITYGCEILKGIKVKSDKYDEIITGERCFIENNSFGENKFDYVILIHIVDHVNNIDEVLSAINKKLKPGGKVIFSGLSNEFSGWYLETFCAGNQLLNNYSNEQYDTILENNGFNMIHFEYMQTGLSALFWKVMMFFNYKTRYKLLFNKIYTKYKFYRLIIRFFVKKSFYGLYILDDNLTKKHSSGLNFFCVGEKT